MHPIIIIGSGLAGYTLAREFRKLDHATPLIIITADSGKFYSKPLLSTALSSKRDVDVLASAEPSDMAAQLNAEVFTHTHVIKIDAAHRLLFTSPDRTFAYSRLIFATGSEVIKPATVGNAVSDILAVNDLEDYAHFRKLIAHKKHIAILGAGLVGCEFANDLVQVGYQVDLIDPGLAPIQRFLPREIALLLKQALRENGVQWHLGELVLAANKIGQQVELLLSNDQRLYADVVLSAIGLKPRIVLAEQAGLQTNFGIKVNNYLQTSDPHIFALGDCAEVSGLVMFFVAPLLMCAKALANTLAGNPTKVSYPAMPITLKTTLFPIVVCPPPRDIHGGWEIEGDGNDVKALFIETDTQQLFGFALTGKKVIEKNQLCKQVPDILPCDEELWGTT